MVRLYKGKGGEFKNSHSDHSNSGIPWPKHSLLAVQFNLIQLVAFDCPNTRPGIEHERLLRHSEKDIYGNMPSKAKYAVPRQCDGN